MSSTTDLNQLRDFVSNDQKKLRERVARLEEFRAMEPKQIKQSDQYTIEEWAHTSTREYNRQLEKLEVAEFLSVEEREMMQQLNKLVWIGDHLKQIAADLRDHLYDVLGPLPAPARFRTNRKMAPKNAATEPSPPPPTEPPQFSDTPAPSTVEDVAAKDEASKSGEAPAESTSQEIARESQPSDSLHKSDEGVEVESEGPLSQLDIEAIGTPDPKGAYKMLDLPFTATDAQIGTAIKKMKLILHPDRNAGDPEAAARFSEFNELMKETIASPGKREAYDNVKDEDDMRELNRRLGLLTFGP